MPAALRRFAHRACLGAVVLLAALALGSCNRETPQVTAKDKAMLVRAGDLAAYGWEFKNPERLEKITKTVAWDGSVRLEYEFETPEAEVDNPLYLGVFVSIENLATDAIISQRAERLGLDIGLHDSGITAREVKDFHPGATFEILELEGQPIGNVFSLRKGSKVYLLIMSGFYFDDPAEWKSLVDAKLRHFTGEAAPAAPVAKPAN